MHEAGIKAELLVTQSAGHAESFMSSNPLEGIHAVCTVGGDGLLFEVVNGLRSRQDADQYSHVIHRSQLRLTAWLVVHGMRIY